MAHDHAHGEVPAEGRLWIALALTGSFLVVETVAGFLSDSLALLSDAGHMLTDVAALGISLAAMRLARRPPDSRRTFGYHRFEILAAAFNAVVLFLVAFYILFEAVGRFRSPQPVADGTMLVIAVVGLLVNLLAMRVLKSASTGSLNVKGAYLEVWADMVGSVGVIAGAIVIRLTGWQWVDSVVAVGIGFWVIPRTWKLLGDSVHILLQGVPDAFDIGRIEGDIRNLPGVESVHDLHLWALTSGRNVLTVHLVLTEGVDEQVVLQATSAMLRDQYGITTTTVQVEQKGLIHPRSVAASDQ